jgi:NAD+ synthase
MNYQAVRNHIVLWLKTYAQASNCKGFVIGISGGIDSAVTSVLCADTGLPVLALNMPIRQNHPELSRSQEHIAWMLERYKNVESQTVDLTQTFNDFEKMLPERARTFLSMANTRARLRMTTLYAFAGAENLLVAGTGNKIEDFGIGFFTKYGDGGVDISPIADLLKTEVYGLANQMRIPESIQMASPTDGLFHDSRTDEDQIGASYPELEWAMRYLENGQKGELDDRQKKVLDIYTQRNRANHHKMVPIPVCEIPIELKRNNN